MRRMKHKKFLFLGLLSWIILAFTTRAENPTGKSRKYTLDEIVITATRGEASRKEIAAHIEVITKAEMDKMPVPNVAEVLQYVPGVYMEFNGGLGSQAVASVQGSDVRHVAVYLDGVPLNQLANPLTDLSYIPIDAIERIEVYKGAASAAWGSSLGGVIHITTATPSSQQPIQCRIQTSYGDFRTLKSRGNISGAFNQFNYFLSLTHDESDGFTDYTAYQQDAVYGKIGYEFNESNRLGFIYSYDEGDSEEPYKKDPWDDLHRKRLFQRLSFETSPVPNLTLFVEGWHHRFDHRVEDVHPDYRETFSDYWERTYGLSTRMQWDTSRSNAFTFGFDKDWGWYDWHGIYSSYKAETGNSAIYTNDTVTFDGFSINAGLRYDDNRDFGDEISPSFGVVYHILKGKALVRGQVARGFSAPPASWIHVPIYGNLDLKPEIGLSYQLGGQVKPFPFLTLEINLFKADIKDLIHFDTKILKYVNFDRVKRQGVEGSIHATFDMGLTISASGSYVDIKDDKTDEVIRNIPRTLYHVQATYSDHWMTHTVLGKYIDHNSTFPETRDQVFLFDYLMKIKLPLPDRYGKFTLYGTVYNLTDVTYLYREIWPHPGRWFEGGVSIIF